MFGYIRINRDELKGKDYDRYGRYYCGLCHALKRECGQAARATLTYDMTFLAILLTALYESDTACEEHRCFLHGGQIRECLTNPYLDYAADMNILLVYHNLMDDWIDERKWKSKIAAEALKPAYLRSAARHREKEGAIRRYLIELHRAERQNEANPDVASGLTGHLMREIFCPSLDLWSDSLGKLGFFLGKWIYLRDAYEDVDIDQQKGNYNPLLGMAKDKDFDQRVLHILTMQAAEAARNFERLPIVQDLELLRNILYSGLWIREPDKKKA